MRICVAAAGVILVALGSVARGDLITFDFDSLAAPRFDRAISGYMTEVYGSQVSSDGARTVAGESDPSDVLIATSLQLLDRGDFAILFEELPILGAQFEGYIIDPTIGEDFVFTAYSSDTEVFSFSRDNTVDSFDSGWLAFSIPVDRVVISDSRRKDVGIDDLIVQPLPVPGTGMLILAGVGAIIGIRRRQG